MDAKALPARPNLEQYKRQAKDLLRAYKAEDSQAVQRVRKIHPRLRKLADEDLAGFKLALADAQWIIAREHGFESWPRFAKHVEALARAGSPVSLFESAVEAIIAGETATLERLLRENPKLIRERSTRLHQAALIHYVGANGVEDYRQRTPQNAVEILKVLLTAGAEVDAVASLYSGSTTLGLVATSVHPVRAGVQKQLMEMLLAAGATLDRGVAPDYTGGLIVNACLHNGRGEAAEFLAQHGARLELEGAAGVGRIELVKSFFKEDGTLNARATKAQMESGFVWACEYGHASVVDFLLQKGVDLLAQANTGMTGLHWATMGGHLPTIKLLLERGAPLEARNAYGGTVLDGVLWAVVNSDSKTDYVPVVEMLIKAGATIQSGSLVWLGEQQGGSAAAKTRIGQVLRRHGAKS